MSGTDDNAPEGGDDGTSDDGSDTGDEGEDGEMSDFSLDGDESGEDDMSNEPAPDGLPEADDDGSGDDMGEEGPEETNVQTNILDLSKLDRTVAKRYCYQQFMDLRSTITSTLSVIDRNETVIDSDVREDAVEKLNKTLSDIKDYMLYKFQIVNYEEALQAYFLFVKAVNDLIEYVRKEGISKK